MSSLESELRAEISDLKNRILRQQHLITDYEQELIRENQRRELQSAYDSSHDLIEASSPPTFEEKTEDTDTKESTGDPTERVIRREMEHNRRSNFYLNGYTIGNLTLIPIRNKLFTVYNINPQTGEGTYRLQDLPRELEFEGHLYHRASAGSYSSSDPELKAKFVPPCKYYCLKGFCKRKYCPFEHLGTRLCPKVCRSKRLDACDVKACPFDHEPNEFNTPLCFEYYLTGRCDSAGCFYSHYTRPQGTAICRPFAHLLFCPEGTKCPFIHFLDCPDYYQNGNCNLKNCLCIHKKIKGLY